MQEIAVFNFKESLKIRVKLKKQNLIDFKINLLLKFSF